MRIEVDGNVRAGHGQCAIAAPGSFQVDDEGHLVFAANPEDIFRADAEDAADACPEQAITIPTSGLGSPAATAGQVPAPMLVSPVAGWHSAG